MRKGAYMIVSTKMALPERVVRFLPGRSAPTPKRLHFVRAMSYGFDQHGRITWIEPYTQNILHDTGEIYILSALFATGYSNYGAAATLYMGLDNRTSLAEGDTLATVAANGEPSTGGYARKSMAINGTGLSGQPFVLSQPGAYYIATSSTQTWTASGGNYGTLRNRFLCTDASATSDGAGDHLVCSLAFSATRTINDGDSLATNLVIGMSE